MSATHLPLVLRLSQRFYAWLMRAYPRTYQQEFAEPMEQLFHDCSVDAFARSGYWGLVQLWGRTLWDYTYSLAREHVAQKRIQLRIQPSGGPMANFTPRAQQVLALAMKEAGRLRHHYAGTEHVLLGLIRDGEGTGTAVSVLMKMGVDLNVLCSRLEAEAIPGTDENRVPPSFTPRVKKVLALADKEARTFHHNYLGRGHILLGLLRAKDGVAARILRGFEVDVDRTRAELLRDPNFSREPPVDESRSNKGAPLRNMTRRAQQAVRHAARIAAAYRVSFTDPEHLLLGILRLPSDAMIDSIWNKFAIDVDALRSEVESTLIRGSTKTRRGTPLATSPSLRQVIASAFKEAEAAHRTGTMDLHHLLLGLLINAGIASDILKSHGIEPEQIRETAREGE